jgi:hypothetical protein
MSKSNKPPIIPLSKSTIAKASLPSSPASKNSLSKQNEKNMIVKSQTGEYAPVGKLNISRLVN